MLFKMATNQISSSRLEQRSVNKFLFAKKCKPCENYRMCDVYEKISFSKKKNALQIVFPQ